MTEHSEHVDFETLNDYVDGRLDQSTMAFVDKHLAVCADCALELSSLQQLLASTALLPKSVLPQDDLWAELKASIDTRKELVLPSATKPDEQSPSRSGHRKYAWVRPTWLAAAAVILVVASSMITAVVLRRSNADDIARISPPESEPDRVFRAAPVLPASFRVAEGQYVSAIDELRAAVDSQRSQLNPETVRTVDHSLAVVDSAIAEARAALLADPNNRTLVDLLSTSYQRKLELLRRTSELTSRI